MKWRNALSFALIACALAAGSARAEVQSRAVSYEDQGEKLTGHLYWDDAIKGARPGVLVIHEWWGLDGYAKRRARMLAELGYVAFAADMYGTGKVTDKPEQAKEWMQGITVDVEWWRGRAQAGLEQLKKAPGVDTSNLAAMGYCFGGGTVLQMAYGGGADLKGVAGFHGSLPAAPEESKGKIHPSILVLNGQADAWVGPKMIENFESALGAAGAQWELVNYGGVLHSFTNPGADKRGIPNLKYDALADARSWARLRGFLKEIFGE